MLLTVPLLDKSLCIYYHAYSKRYIVRLCFTCERGRDMGGKKTGVCGISMTLLAALAAAVLLLLAPQSAAAAEKNGFVKENGATYYYVNGVKATGWRTINSERYYFLSNGRMKTGWMDVGTKTYYFQSNGKMIRGRYLYDSKTRTYRYFTEGGLMCRGWYRAPDGKNIMYFSNYPSVRSKDGIKQFGFSKIDGSTYYFQSGTGYRVKGWVTRKSDGARFYMDPAKNGAMAVNTTKVIDGVTFTFDSKGFSIIKLSNAGTVTRQAGSSRTIKNYLLNGLQACGRVLYIWGGGWTQSTVKGVPQSWIDFYNSQNYYYNYDNYSNLSESNRIKGLDCSGFVGWNCYQTMQTSSYANSGYTVVSGSVGSSYVSRGWGSILSQSQLAANGYKLYPGDIGYDANHVWIILGQCKDKSCVVLHSTTQAGVQLSGTPTPSGNYDSQAVALCKQYMAVYPGFKKFPYKTSCGDFVRRGSYFRWNRSTLADPEGYMNKNAAQILSDLYR